MSVENIFFVPVREVCHRDVVTCERDTALVEAADRMRERNISSIIVSADQVPVGILTDRDLRNKVVAQGRDLSALRVDDIMNSPLVTIREDRFLYEALHLMSRRRIHRLCVVDEDGALCGILTDSDALRLQSRSPQQLIKDIEEAASVDELKAQHAKLKELVVHLAGTRVATKDLVQTVARLNDQILVRLIELVRERSYPDLTDRFAFLVLGSEGRQEQTLSTDQDNAIVFADDLSEAEQKRLAAFSVEVIDSLIAVGVPPCKGGIMAKNAQWRRSLSEWKGLLDKWLRSPTPENILSGSMFFDLRTLYGDAGFESALRRDITEKLTANALFLVYSAANAVRFKPPLGFFGRIKGKKRGGYGESIDIKKAGIFPITEGVKAMALKEGIAAGGTRERVLGLEQAGVLGAGRAENLIAAFDFLVSLRLRGQLLAIEQDREPDNYLSLDRLNRIEYGRLRLSLEEVDRFQEFLRHRFRLNQISR